MAYPADGYPKTEFLINGTWVDVSSRVRYESGLQITRGRANEQGRVAPQTCSFTLNNRDGLFSNRNPSSTYFGQLPRNTQMRVTAGTDDTYVRMPTDFTPSVADRPSTPDSANLDIVGDIEVRLEFKPYSRRPRKGMILFSKYKLTGNQRSWLLYMTQDGYLGFSWSTDGTTAGRITQFSSAPLPISSDKLAVKVTLDVVNGGNRTLEFYTAPSIDGTYTLLSTSTVVGNTNIFASDASVCIGHGDDSSTIFGTTDFLRGRIYKARVYQGIGGTVRANPDFTAQPVGTTSFADSAGATWTVGGRARVTSDRIRFWGELSSLPQRWDRTGRDVWVSVTAAGSIRRLGQGETPLNSPIFRTLTRRSGLIGYWPLEDGSQSGSVAASAVSGARSGSVTKVQFADDGTLPGSKPAASFIDAQGRFIASPKFESVYTGVSYFTFYFKLPSLPATLATLVRLSTNGTARTITISLDSGGFNFNFYSSDGSVIDLQTVTYGPADYFPNGRWIAFNLLMTAGGGNVVYQAKWSNVAGESFVASAANIYAGTVGRITNIDFSAAGSAAFIDASIAHVHVANADLGFVSTAMARSANGFIGETAGARLSRLAAEESVGMEIVGDPASTETMGYQGTDTFMDLLYECQDADLGILSESRDSLALQYRTRKDMEHNTNATLSYTAKHLADVPTAVEDDQGITNDVTVTKPNASSGQREIAVGSMSTQAPPNGIGRYRTEVTLNAYLNSRLPDIASWIANLGTTEEMRYTTLSLGMHRTPILADSSLFLSLAALDLGDTAKLGGLPSWLPPEDAFLLLQGYSETLYQRLWTIEGNTTPALIYNTGRYDYETDLGRTRYDHSSATLNASLTTTATTVVSNANSTTPTTLDLWTSNAGSYPFDVMINGERMTFTQAPVTVGQIQTFSNVTRSVNNVVKTHTANKRIRLFRVFTYQL
jgi:hypothetical protein